MTVFVVRYSYVDRPADLDEVRPRRHAYFERLAATEDLLASGQLLGTEAMSGLLVLRAEDRASAERLLDEDPYALAGLVAERRIEVWRPTMGTWV